MSKDRIHAPKQPRKTKSSADKTLADAFKRFALSGYKFSLFTENLYRDLRCSFGFIAHYDRAGFWDYHFARWDSRLSTLVEMSGRPRPTAVEAALSEVVVEYSLVTTASHARDREVEAQEREELARLKAKYEG